MAIFQGKVASSMWRHQIRLRDSRIAELEADLESTESQLTQAERDLVGMRTQFRDQHERLRARFADGRAEISRLGEQNHSLTAEKVELLHRTSDLTARLRAAEEVAATLTRIVEKLPDTVIAGLGSLLNPVLAAESAPIPDPYAQFRDPTSGIGVDAMPESGFVPFIEFDPSMESVHNFPLEGEWTAQTDPATRAATEAMHGPPRPNGQGMFRAGTSGPPPVGGTE